MQFIPYDLISFHIENIQARLFLKKMTKGSSKGEVRIPPPISTEGRKKLKAPPYAFGGQKIYKKSFMIA